MKPNPNKEVVFGDRNDRAVRTGRAGARAVKFVQRLTRSKNDNYQADLKTKSELDLRLAIAEQDVRRDSAPNMDSRFAEELKNGVELKMHPKTGGTITATGVKDKWKDEHGEGPRTVWKLHIESPRGHASNIFYITNYPAAESAPGAEESDLYTVEKSKGRQSAGLSVERVDDGRRGAYYPATEIGIMGPATGIMHGSNLNTLETAQLFESVHFAFTELTKAKVQGNLAINPLSSEAPSATPEIVQS